MLELLDISNNYARILDIRVKLEKEFKTQSSILIQYTIESNNLRYFIIFELDSKKIMRVNLPARYDVKKVDQFIDVHGQYYIVASDFRGQRCLFTSYNKSAYFVTVKDDCPILIHPSLPGIIFANFNPDTRPVHTYISTNNGKTFETTKHENNNSACVDGLCNAQLLLSCNLESNAELYKEWFITLEGIDESYPDDNFENFLSFDGGKIWKTVPSINYAFISMNRGGIFVGLNKKTNKIIYTFDEGKRYYYLPIHDDGELIVGRAIIGRGKRERFLIYGQSSNRSTLVITQVDFTNIFKRECQHEDYSPWSVTRSNRKCYQGQELIYLKKNIYSLCIDNQTVMKIISTPCPCSLDDFHCRYNYEFKDQYCRLDRFTDFINLKLTCGSEGRPVYKLNGFAKLEPGVCVPESFDANGKKSQADVCVSYKYSNILLFITMRHAFMYELDYMGHPMPKIDIQDIIIPPEINLRLPMIYDMVNNYIYHFSHQTVSVYHKHGFLIDKFELFRFGFSISLMTIDHHMNLYIILDSNLNLFVVCLRTNFVKLLAPNVTYFEYNPNNL
ncbi:VPS10 domain-containing receptor SorCS1 [Thelohanellus kitauei]|uniref:VPS10 domain-containing receptor SorCS1 n=1 Tax=Thelohanellus kitauei TaxID=669202 RepID=A0A0C2MYU3_THEKT|nr:VPS10 domain-containing receptor SorCS1 [Thelohanellus kitauei]